jgi:hypothetical protein
MALRTPQRALASVAALAVVALCVVLWGLAALSRRSS